MGKAWRLHYHHANGGGWQTRIPLELFRADSAAAATGGVAPLLEFKFVLVDGPVFEPTTYLAAAFLPDLLARERCGRKEPTVCWELTWCRSSRGLKPAASVR